METDRPSALRQAIQAARKGGTLSIPRVYSGLLDKVPYGAAYGTFGLIPTVRSLEIVVAHPGSERSPLRGGLSCLSAMTGKRNLILVLGRLRLHLRLAYLCR